MLEVQKQAVAQARESEKKAKAAEAKAMEMVRLKDEAAKAKSMFLANVYVPVNLRAKHNIANIGTDPMSCAHR